MQGFRTAEEVDRFGQLMDELCYIVATKHSGSLKVRLLTNPAHAPQFVALTTLVDLVWCVAICIPHAHTLPAGGLC